MTPSQVTVIYHRADYDGIFSREIARKFFGENAQYIGWDYGDPKIPVPDGAIYIIDLSPSCLETIPVWDRVIWIDHHKSAIAEYPKTIPGYRIDGVAACRLAWQWFFNPMGPMNPNLQEPDYHLPTDVQFKNREVSEPLAVRLAGEYDIWDHRDNDADVAFQFGLDANANLDFRLLLGSEEICNRAVMQIVNEGYAAMRCYAKRDADIMEHRSFLEDFEGLRFLVLNTPRCNSNTFKFKDVPETGHDALLAFYCTGDDWSVSMYHAAHRKDLDLSEIAKKYGGGGHRGACGFRAMRLPFVKNLCS
jgi:oligoribonuclease NrnB/cAMP/cGMP phosphodiesterase (DHH superfamily)